MPAQEARSFQVQARSVEGDPRLNIPPGNVWVTICRGHLHTGWEGEKAIECLARDFDVKVTDTRLVLASDEERAAFAQLCQAFGMRTPGS